jgi:uncharacterized phage-associated protein
MEPITASDLAKHIIYWFSAKKNQQIDNLKLQKLLYYTQAWSLAIHDCPVFQAQIEAWVHGPVVPPVFREYRDLRWSPISLVDDGNSKISSKLQKHLDEVLGAYGDYTGWQLERLAHNEHPWQAARGNLPPDVPSSNVITHESMKTYYRARMKA